MYGAANSCIVLSNRALIQQAGEILSSAQGTPEEIAEEMVSHVDGGDIKSIELERKHAEIIPGQAGSGVQRGSAAAAAQVTLAPPYFNLALYCDSTRTAVTLLVQPLMDFSCISLLPSCWRRICH